MICHIPGRAAVSVTLDTLSALKDGFEHFVGMKHAVNDLGFVSECLNASGADFRIFVGLEELGFPAMAIGNACLDRAFVLCRTVRACIHRVDVPLGRERLASNLHGVTKMP